MPDHAKEVHVQLTLRLLGAGEFHRAGDAEADVVDQHVDMVLPLQDLRDCGGERLLLRDVGHDVLHPGHALGPAGKLIDRIAPGEHRLRRAAADAGGPSGDHTYLAHSAYLLKTSAITPTASSMSACVCVAIRLVRSRHSWGAAAGGRDELTYTPPS